jgi:hypothetical protein
MSGYRVLGTKFNRRKWLSYADAIVLRISQTSFQKMTLIRSRSRSIRSPVSVSHPGQK